MTPCFVPKGRFLYTVIVLEGGFLLLSSRVPGVCLGGMVMDEIDTCITLVRSYSGENIIFPVRPEVGNKSMNKGMQLQ